MREVARLGWLSVPLLACLVGMDVGAVPDLEEPLMKVSLVRLLLALALLPAAALPAWAQGTAGTSLSGTVVDSGGGIIPGVNVVAKNNATSATFETITNSSGAFSLPALDAGTY